jgi:hypothetical protein
MPAAHQYAFLAIREAFKSYPQFVRCGRGPRTRLIPTQLVNAQGRVPFIGIQELQCTNESTAFRCGEIIAHQCREQSIGEDECGVCMSAAHPSYRVHRALSCSIVAAGSSAATNASKSSLVTPV